MDPYANWDELVPVKSGTPEEDFSQYFLDCKNFDNLFNEALTTLQDLDVPSGHGQTQPPPQSVLTLPFRHSKKSSGTAIFGFVDHNRDLSINGMVSDLQRAPVASSQSILPNQLARRLALPISNDHLDFNFSQPLEVCKPIHISEEDEYNLGKKDDDFMVTNPKSYKFPPDEFEYLNTIPIHHPKNGQRYPDDIEYLLASKAKPKYVPIPVQEPLVERKTEVLNMNNVYLPPPSNHTTSLSEYQTSPEPHSPALPQQHVFSSPQRMAPMAPISSSPYEKKTFHNPQFFSDDYYSEPARQNINSSPFQDPGTASLRSSPIKYLKGMNESYDETVSDANETILQLTPLKSLHPPMTPSKNKITLEWSPIISPNAKASNDVRRAIQELSPKRIIKKTSLLPPGELDRYWEGPDDNKEFTCTYKNCGKRFTRRYNVRSHIQTHLSDRPFTCTYCPKSFVRQHDLNRHVKSHMVAKHCRCKCGKEFTRVEGYRKHMAKGICLRSEDGVSKPSTSRRNGGDILDGLTSNRLNEELGL